MYLVHKASTKSSNSPPSRKPYHEWGEKKASRIREKCQGPDTMDPKLKPGYLWQLAPSGALCSPHCGDGYTIT